MPTKTETQHMIDKILETYPEKARIDRENHVKPNDPEDSQCAVKNNMRSRPGVMTTRGCAYAGSKGVVWGPIKDMVHLSHGPVGCGQYSWASRRNYSTGEWGLNNFVSMQFTSDFQERDVVFGGDKKLTQITKEIEELFPLNRGVTIQSECPIGLIGDDIEAVARKSTKDLGKTVVPVRCEGFRGVSQSLGHHIANDTIRDHVLGKGELKESGPYDVVIIGDYNIGGDAWASRITLEEMGLRVIAQWSGDGTLNELEITHKAKLNLVHCYRSMNYIARELESRYNIPWMEYNFFGPTKIAHSLRKIAGFFDETIQANAERIIAQHNTEMQQVIDHYRPRLGGKKVMLFVGGLRPRHVIGAYEDLGMEVIGTGYEFGHQDDYERTYKQMTTGTVIYDDPSAYEFEAMVDRLRPDLVGSGVKEKYVFHKMGLPFRQMHSWDYSGPYHGYDGFHVFARDIDMAVNNPAWGLVKAPWEIAKIHGKQGGMM